APGTPLFEATDDSGDDPELAPAAGIMYLTPEQVDRAAAVTGHDADAIRSDIAANIDAAAALLADGWDGTAEDLRARTAAFLGADGPAALALDEPAAIIANGFDATPPEGERLALRGPRVEVAARVLPGHYPPFTWIRSPNFSSRLGYPIRF